MNLDGGRYPITALGLAMTNVIASRHQPRPKTRSTISESHDLWRRLRGVATSSTVGLMIVSSARGHVDPSPSPATAWRTAPLPGDGDRVRRRAAGVIPGDDLAAVRAFPGQRLSAGRPHHGRARLHVRNRHDHQDSHRDRKRSRRREQHRRTMHRAALLRPHILGFRLSFMAGPARAASEADKLPCADQFSRALGIDLASLEAGCAGSVDSNPTVTGGDAWSAWRPIA